MEHTEHYQLSLWDADDRIMREDFNDNNAKIDAALADTRRFIGTYTGDGTNKANGGQEISIGFRASFILVTSDGNGGRGLQSGSAIIAEKNSDCGCLTDNGFRAWTNNISSNVGNLNANGIAYWYVAFP